MSVRLIAEIRDHAPADLTPGERLVLVWIAEQSRDEARRLENGNVIPARTCFPGNEDLARWCGVTEDGLRKIFGRLAKRGLEVRVQQGTDKTGRPVYATKGWRPLLRLPDLAGTPVLPNAQNAHDGGTVVPPEAVPGYRLPGTVVPPEAVPGYRPPVITPSVPRDVPQVQDPVVHGENRAATDAPSTPWVDDYEDTPSWLIRVLRGLDPDERELAEQRIAQDVNRFKILNEIKARRAENQKKRHREAVLR